MVCGIRWHGMGLQWRDDLPTDWDAVPEQPPQGDEEYVIEPHGNGVLMVPIRASVEDGPTESYIYCDARNVASLGESTA